VSGSRERGKVLCAADGAHRLKKQGPDPTTKQHQTSGWKVVLGFAVGLGLEVLAAVAGMNMQPPGSSPGSAMQECDPKCQQGCVLGRELYLMTVQTEVHGNCYLQVCC
jgi:hypothetical protein